MESIANLNKGDKLKYKNRKVVLKSKNFEIFKTQEKMF